MLAFVVAATQLAWRDDAPLTPEHGGFLFGSRNLAWVFFVLLAGAFVVYATALLVAARARVAVVAALAVAIQLAPLGAPLLLSSDAWTYWAYGTIAREGGNPYAETPDDYSVIAAHDWVGFDWRDATSVYGPVFTLVSTAVDTTSEDVAAWAFKAFAAAMILGAAACAASFARRPAFVWAFIGWNPLLAVHFGGGGHNDALMAALLISALATRATGRRQVAGVAWALAAFVKWVPLVLLPLRALEARSRRIPVGHVGFVATAAFSAGISTWIFGTAWLETLTPLARNAAEGTRFALPSRAEQLGVPRDVAVGFFAVAFVIAYAWLAREAWRGRARLGLAAGLLLLATPYLAPWYVAWAVPLAAAEDDRTAQILALALCAYLLPQTIPL